MKFVVVAAVSAFALAACQQPAEPADAPAATGAADPQPSEMMQQTFSSCEWGKVEGSGLAVWSFACPAEFGNVRLVADPALPGFSLEGTQDGVTSRSPAIVVFEKATGDDVSAIIEQVRAKSPGPDTATCALEQIEGESMLPNAWTFVPTGEAKARWEAAVGGDELGDAPEQGPCGPLGPQIVGDRAFVVVPGDPTKVAFIEFGSEIQIFDPATLRAGG
ncbi:hypothetical protein [Brevundimonas bacteroides]|uniref:hypothetical protein n=1 Tax=Brevundimonas bacteroides TaxID=74311 RepID=UPI000496AB09|nr:hypothetical protein [Brevundimonas bacteroides]